MRYFDRFKNATPEERERRRIRFLMYGRLRQAEQKMARAKHSRKTTASLSFDSPAKLILSVLDLPENQWVQEEPQFQQDFARVMRKFTRFAHMVIAQLEDKAERHMLRTEYVDRVVDVLEDFKRLGIARELSNSLNKKIIIAKLSRP